MKPLNSLIYGSEVEWPRVCRIWGLPVHPLIEAWRVGCLGLKGLGFKGLGFKGLGFKGLGFKV